MSACCHLSRVFKQLPRRFRCVIIGPARRGISKANLDRYVPQLLPEELAVWGQKTTRRMPAPAGAGQVLLLEPLLCRCGEGRRALPSLRQRTTPPTAFFSSSACRVPAINRDGPGTRVRLEAQAKSSQRLLRRRSVTGARRRLLGGQPLRQSCCARQGRGR